MVGGGHNSPIAALLGEVDIYLIPCKFATRGARPVAARLRVWCRIRKVKRTKE